jgi:anhydro-N-acetylmuramic acid kinase
MLVVGLMSGTSMDGVDAALLETDGEGGEARGFVSRPYDDATRALIAAALERARAMDAPGDDDVIRRAEAALTRAHAEAVRALPGWEEAELVGFHGQTVAHRPERGWTWQVGDAAWLARALGKRVVSDFRSADVAAGGQGAPLAPAWHRARLGARIEQLARLGDRDGAGVLNLGGVGNLTWFVGGAWGAFDTGPGNALVDDWVREHTGAACDLDGALAGAGAVHEDVLASMCDLEWFDRPGPKSLDRNDFPLGGVRGLSVADGARTLTAFTGETVALGLRLVPGRIAELYVTGGGRLNPVMMAEVAGRTGAEVRPVEALGWDGDALEAEAFAYLAARVVRGLPTSWPETTGCRAPVCGGIVAEPG